ncbi:MAG: DUF2490 domain-containing protein [Prolixibacteraceae bacterium]
MKFFALLILTLFFFDQLKADENNVAYIWNTNSFSYKLNDKNTLSFNEKVHFKLDQKAINFYYIDFNLSHTLTRHCSTALAYRRLLSKQTTNWSVENRFMSYLNLHWKLNFIDLQLSNRLSYQQYPQGKDNFRYYNKFTTSFPIQVFSSTIYPYLTEEVFVKLNKENFHLTRTYVGIRFRESKQMALDFFFAENFQKQVNLDWANYGILGFNLAFHLN